VDTAIDAWILAGQSNMEGSALLADPRRETETDPWVESLGSHGEWVTATDPLQWMWESYTPVHQAIHRAGLPPERSALPDDVLAADDRRERFHGAGLGVPFGRAMVAATGRPVALIPTAHGGTSLEQWEPGHGGLPRDSTATLYGALLDRVARARQREGLTVRGMLWYQGESDGSPERAADYAERFDAWIAGLRADLGDADLPIYVVQLGRFAQADPIAGQTVGAWDRVREAQHTLPGRDPHSGVVSAIDLGLSDNIHIDAPGLARLGRRLARLATDARTGPDVERVEYLGALPNGHERVRVICRGVTGGWHGPRLPGFSFTESDGTPIRNLRVVDAYPDPADPTAIVVICSWWAGPALSGVHLTYGRGFDPMCLAVDDVDLPLPAFGPQPIRGVSGIRS
jgi:hypothetical protein